MGFRLGAISYLTDANKITDAELEKVRGSRYFILNALRDEPHYSHFHLDAAIDVGKRSGAEEVLFTHISHHFEPHAALSKRLPKGFGRLRDRHLWTAEKYPPEEGVIDRREHNLDYQLARAERIMPL